MSTILSYNKNQVTVDGSIEVLDRGYNVWVDVIDPNEKDLDTMAHKFNLNQEAIQTCLNKSKKPEILQRDCGKTI
jgi:magnesium transporter